MNTDSGRQLRADGHAGVQRSHRVLKYHGKQRAAKLLQLAFPQLRDITAIYRDRAALAPRARRQQVQDALTQHAFAAAGVAHDGEDLTRAQRKADVAHGLDLSRRGEKADGQIFYFQ